MKILQPKVYGFISYHDGRLCSFQFSLDVNGMMTKGFSRAKIKSHFEKFENFPKKEEEKFEFHYSLQTLKTLLVLVYGIRQATMSP